jgi:ribose 5-phosphate isomerase B
MKIGIGNDHGATELKMILMPYLEEKGYEVINYGTDSNDSVNYPDVAEKLAIDVAAGKLDNGILMCGTGIGMGLAANKVNGIRAAIVSESCSAALAKQHNNANIICLGARVVGSEVAKLIVNSFLEAEFEGGRHQTRVDMIMDVENRN